MTAGLMHPAVFAFLSFSQPTVTQELMILGAAIITLCGMWLCWGAPRHRMSIEERAKDGKMSEDQARWRIQTMEVIGPIVIITGVGLLAFALMR